MVALLALQALVFAVSGVAAWALADAVGIHGFGDRWLLNGCVYGVAGYVLLGVQVDAIDFDKPSIAWVPLRIVSRFGRELLDLLAIKGIESKVTALPDPELEQRAFDIFWTDFDPRADMTEEAKLHLHDQLSDACAQLRTTAQAVDGRGRLRAFVRSAMIRHMERDHQATVAARE